MAGLAKLHRGIVTDRGGPLRAEYVAHGCALVSRFSRFLAFTGGRTEKAPREVEHKALGSFATAESLCFPPMCMHCWFKLGPILSVKKAGPLALLRLKL